MPDKKVIIACYGFPPNPGIGGRRWAKFAKYLAKAGWQVHVILAEPSTTLVSDWERDVIHPNITRHYLPVNYPKALSAKHGDSLIKKIQFRFYKWLYSNTQRKRIFDATFLWEKPFTKKLDQLISVHNIKNVICSGAPFYQLYYAAKLKEQKFPNLTLITDFRDPWLSATDYGINHLKGEKLEYEKSLFEFVCAQSNKLIAPNPFMLKNMLSALDNTDVSFFDKLQEFPHSFDEDDINPFLSASQRTNKQIVLFYAGTIYNDLKETFNLLAKTLDLIKVEKPELYNKLEINFYTGPNNVPDYFLNHSKVIRFKTPVGKDIFKIINEASACLILQSKNNKDFRTTKFFEFISFRKPYIVLGAQGFVSEYVEAQKLGVFIPDNNFYTKFVETLEKISENNLEFNSTFNITEFNCESQTNKLIKLLQQ